MARRSLLAAQHAAASRFCQNRIPANQRHDFLLQRLLTLLTARHVVCARRVKVTPGNRRLTMVWLDDAVVVSAAIRSTVPGERRPQAVRPAPWQRSPAAPTATRAGTRWLQTGSLGQQKAASGFAG
jgi:hypothetical protein